MTFSNNRIDDPIMLSPLLSESAPALMNLWKAQMAWTSLVGLPTIPSKVSDDVTPSLEDFLKR